jgi:hypothetical protein
MDEKLSLKNFKGLKIEKSFCSVLSFQFNEPWLLLLRRFSVCFNLVLKIDDLQQQKHLGIR